MDELKAKLSRRELLGGIAGGAAVIALGPTLPLAAPEKPRVIRVESDKVWENDSRNPRIIAAMLNKGLVTLANAASAAEAWRQFVKPEMRVGLKINLLGRPLIYTAPEITEAAVVGLIASGVKPANIIVWDRWQPHFGPTRYKIGKGTHGESIEAGGNYSQTVIFKGSRGNSPLDTIVTEKTDVTIGFPVLKDHSTAGVTLSLKNIAFGCYNHYSASPNQAHEGNCEPFISEAYQHFASHYKQPLIILDATLACYDGGPKPSDAGRLWRENALYLATDPVALDTVCRKLLMAKRIEKGLPDKMAESRHIEAAAQKKLGIGDLSKIEVITVKV